MLGKLIKVEWKATKRIFFPLYIAIALIAIINGIFFHFSDKGFRLWAENGVLNTQVGSQIEEIVSSLIPYMQLLFLILYIGIVIGAGLISIFVTFQRYYKNVLGQEGYLMNTLPVKSWELILSKGILSSIWTIASALVVMISFFVMMMITEPTIIGSFARVINSDFIDLSFGIWNLIAFLIEFFIVALISCWMFSMKAYAAMSLGHLIQKHRLIGAIGFYIAIDFAESMVGMILLVLGTVLFSNSLVEFADNMTQGQAIGMVHLIFIGSICLNLIVGFIYFMISKNILDKKLNLE